MDQHLVSTLVATIELISNTLDVAPDSWRDHLQPIRNITTSLEFLDTAPDETRKRWQIPLISAFQRVAYADPDNGGIQDIADWCLRQSLTLLQVYPEDVDLLALIGRYWLLSSQKSLARIHLAEGDASSSGTSQGHPLSQSEELRQTRIAAIEAEDRLQTGDYVEARGTLLPAIEYLKRAVDAARVQGRLNGPLLSTAAEAYMSMGNVMHRRINEPYFNEALGYLRAAREIEGYHLPDHLQQYLDEFGPLNLRH